MSRIACGWLLCTLIASMSLLAQATEPTRSTTDTAQRQTPAEQLGTTKQAETKRVTKKGYALTMSAKKSPSPEKRLAMIEALNASWFYTWGANIPMDLDELPEDMQFVPMTWGKWSVREPEKLIARLKAQAEAGHIDTLLGFNEPDRKTQSNITVEKALELWPVLEKTGLRLGSPACTHPDDPWMQEFMREVEKRGLRVDFITVHSYAGPNANAFMKKMEKIHKMYNRPIWITELGVGDWKAKSVQENKHKPEKVYKFMAELLPRLDRTPYIERYCWFCASPKSAALGTSALFDENYNLTRLGKLYASHKAAPAPMPEKVTPKKRVDR